MMQAKSRSESKRICIQTDCAIAAALKDEIERLQAEKAKLREAIEEWRVERQLSGHHELTPAEEGLVKALAAQEDK